MSLFEIPLTMGAASFLCAVSYGLGLRARRAEADAATGALTAVLRDRESTVATLRQRLGGLCAFATVTHPTFVITNNASAARRLLDLLAVVVPRGETAQSDVWNLGVVSSVAPPADSGFDRPSCVAIELRVRLHLRDEARATLCPDVTAEVDRFDGELRALSVSPAQAGGVSLILVIDVRSLSEAGARLALKRVFHGEGIHRLMARVHDPADGLPLTAVTVAMLHDAATLVTPARSERLLADELGALALLSPTAALPVHHLHGNKPDPAALRALWSELTASPAALLYGRARHSRP